MRTTAFILAFIVIALSLLPCADRSNVIKATKGNTELAAHNDHKKNQGDNDLCPPFCHCGCCACVLIKTSFPSSIAPQFTFINIIPAILDGNITGISRPIWQPPQLIA